MDSKNSARNWGKKTAIPLMIWIRNGTEERDLLEPLFLTLFLFLNHYYSQKLKRLSTMSQRKHRLRRRWRRANEIQLNERKFCEIRVFAWGLVLQNERANNRGPADQEGGNEGEKNALFYFCTVFVCYIFPLFVCFLNSIYSIWTPNYNFLFTFWLNKE